MADNGDFALPDGWYDSELNMYLDFAGAVPDMADDAYLQSLFHEALFDLDLTVPERDAAYDALTHYMNDEYGIDFEDVFDWEGYREWYG